MVKKKLNIKPEFHSPEELLAGAESLLLSSDPQVMRAVVLESITALEAFVEKTIFKLLEKNIEPKLVALLKKKTKMDFDSRLGILAPIALDMAVDKNTELWKKYKDSKEIRNRVTHRGTRVNKKQAEFVLNTVKKWLSHLGMTAEVDLALIKLKKYIESKNTVILDQGEAENIISSYFSKQKIHTESQLRYDSDFKADIELSFDNYRVAIEVKLLREGYNSNVKIIADEIKKGHSIIEYSGFDRYAIVIFGRTNIPESLDCIKSFYNGKVSVIGIKVGRDIQSLEQIAEK